jgi:hypothetical protein
MPTLKDLALKYTGKKELYDLDKIDVSLEVKQDTFDGKGQNEGKKIAYNYIEIDGYKYTIKADLMQQIKQTLESRPQTKFIKVNRAANGTLYIIPLD